MRSVLASVDQAKLSKQDEVVQWSHFKRFVQSVCRNDDSQHFGELPSSFLLILKWNHGRICAQLCFMDEINNFWKSPTLKSNLQKPIALGFCVPLPNLFLSPDYRSRSTCVTFSDSIFSFRRLFLQTPSFTPTPTSLLIFQKGVNNDLVDTAIITAPFYTGACAVDPIQAFPINNRIPDL
jgi:hypothetical protein